MTRLLVSVRDVAEAETALAGGADLIDIKDPAAGSLGRAADETRGAIVAAVAGRRPVSAAMGEWVDETGALPDLAGLALAKWGLAGAVGRPWQEGLRSLRTELTRQAPGCGLVVAAYADAERARAPSLTGVLAFVRSQRPVGLLLDTREKDGRTLLDWLSLAELATVAQTCRRCGTMLALAGSLGVQQVALVRRLEPDWIAVRGAACVAGRRDGTIDESRVRQLATLLRSARGGN